MTDREIFHRNLTDLLNTTKAKQKDIAEYAEVSYQTVSAWVNGINYPRAEQMEKLCKFFGIRQSALTEDPDSPQVQEEKLLDIFRSLSDEGKEKMLERAEEMQILYPMRRKRNG